MNKQSNRCARIVAGQGPSQAARKKAKAGHLLAACCILALAGTSGYGQALPASAPASSQAVVAVSDGARFPVGRIDVAYRVNMASQPSLAEVRGVFVPLGRTADGYVAWRPGLPMVTRRIQDIGIAGPEYFHASALRRINEKIVEFYNNHGFIGVYVAPDVRDINQEGKDLRPQGQVNLRLVITPAQVKGVRTIASGERIDPAKRIQNPAHAMVREQSPVKPGEMVNKNVVDDYVLQLNRQPGRRVDVAIARADSDEPAEVMLDYLVTENRPWYVFGQVSNTGTKETSEWREHFGFVNTQLTNHDDVFSIDYVTAGFDSSHAVMASYEAPLFGLRRLRGRVYGTWSKFTASDIGLNLENFKGDETMGGAEIIANVYQRKELFVDVFAGSTWSQITGNGSEGVILDENQGTIHVVQPYVGVRAEQFKDTSSLYGDTRILYGETQASQENIDRVGRVNANPNWWIAQGNATYSFYLEPLLTPAEFQGSEGTLAHEIMLSARGQYAFGRKVIAQEEQTVGGFYTVRGYPESLVAADNVVIGTVEYRYHIPRGLSVHEEPSMFFGQPFRYAPGRRYGRPDWDLIFRTFVDAASTHSNVKSEEDQNLLSTGVGVELQIKQNFNIRLDWGVALEGVNVDSSSKPVDRGDSRIHLSATFLY